MKRRTLWTILLLAAGCSARPAPVSLPSAEKSFAQQTAAVRAGNEGTILVEQSPLTDDDLRQLAGLNSLIALCIDHEHSQITAAGIAHLQDLPRLTHLRIRGGIDDETLAAIAKLERLTILNLPRGKFTAHGLTQLAAVPDLEMLRFHSPKITDADLPLLGKFPSLKRLHLIDLPISDAGLAELAKIERLESLYIDGGRITDAAWDELFARRPGLHVHINQQHHDRDPRKHAH